MLRRTQIRRTPYSPPGDFVLFFKAYPLQSEEARALTEWLKLDPDEALTKEIMASVERQKASESWREKRYIPLAHNFLRGQRWKDDPLLVVNEPPASISECQWSFNEITSTYSQIIEGQWVKQPRSVVPDDCRQTMGGHAHPVQPDSGRVESNDDNQRSHDQRHNYTNDDPCPHPATGRSPAGRDQRFPLAECVGYGRQVPSQYAAFCGKIARQNGKSAKARRDGNGKRHRS